MKTRAIISDLDGTLALFKEKGHRGPYDATHCDQDDINIPVLEVIKRFQESHAIVFCSGREDKYMSPTIKFIEKCGIKDYFLFMRKTSDKRKDSIIKEEIYRNRIEPNFDVLLVLDDRNQTCNQWRSMGLTCFQVAPGDF
jgi:hypothetical protein